MCLETTSALAFLGTCLAVRAVVIVKVQAEQLPSLKPLEQARVLPVPNNFQTWSTSTEHLPFR